MSAPSSYQLEQAMSALMAAQARLAQDGAYDDDKLALIQAEKDVDVLLAKAVRAAQHARSMADAAKERIEALKVRQIRYSKREEAMRGAVFAAMDALGRRKLELPDATVTISPGPASGYVEDEELIPETYKVTTTTIDKAKLNADAKDGLVIPGYSYGNGMAKLTIRSL